MAFMRIFTLIIFLLASSKTSLALFEYDRAISTAQHNNIPASIELFKQALVDQPDNPNLLYDAGVSSFKNKEYSHAASYFEKAAQLASQKPLQEQAYFNLGNTLVELKELHKAIDAYDQVLKTNPTHAQALHNKEVVKKMLEQQQQQKNDQQEKQKKDKQEQEKDKREENPDQQQQKQSSDQSDKQKQQDQQEQQSPQQKPEDNDSSKQNSNNTQDQQENKKEQEDKSQQSPESGDDKKQKNGQQKQEKNKQNKNSQNQKQEQEQQKNKSGKKEEQANDASGTQDNAQTNAQRGTAHDAQKGDEKEQQIVLPARLEKLMAENAKSDNHLNKKMMKAMVSQQSGAGHEHNW
jgi:Ca-activated chloride channel homolog